MLNKEDKIIELIQELSKGKEACDYYLLDDFFSVSTKESREIAQRICDTKRNREISERIKRIDPKRGRARLMSEFSEKKRNPKRVANLIIKVSSIAAMIIGVSFGIFLLNNEKSSVIPVESIEEEVSVPTLITNNGKYHLTDNSVEIKNDKDYEVKNEDSKLSYTSNSEGNTELVYNILKVPPRYTYELVLSDGTEITLNAATVMKYPVVLADDERVVEIDGEAYFKVAKSDTPFIVKCNGVDIKVYGTEFNVNTFDNNVETVLIEGSVGVSSESCGERTLKPNNLLLMNNREGVINFSEKVDTDSYTAWKNNTFFYNNQPFDRVIEDIQRWYGVTINYPEDIKTKFLTANVKKYNDINELFNFLEVVVSMTIVREGRRTYSLN